MLRVPVQTSFVQVCALFAVSTVLIAAPLSLAAEMAIVENNQPFAIRQPISVKPISERSPSEARSVPAQRSGNQLVFIASNDRNSTATFHLDTGANTKSQLKVEPTETGFSINALGKPIGQLSWGLLIEPAPKPATRGKASSDDAADPAARAEDASYSHPDYAATFQPIPLQFKRTEQGPVFERWHAETSKAGLRLLLDLESYADGFIDIKGSLKNESATSSSGVLCDVVTKWEHPSSTERVLAYDSVPYSFGETTTTSFRAGAGHHLALQRGVDWLRVALNGTSVEWMNDFSESFSVIEEGTKKSADKWINANQPQLGCEVQATPSAIYSITEITRPVIKRFRDRFAPWVLPAKGEQAEFSSRIVVQTKPLDNEDADAQFVGYTCYQGQLGDSLNYRFGVPYVKFGTSYFPYSVLGENFDRYKLPGQDREGYWPLSADTVNNWQLFADDIRRDLRIARAMGFEVIRLHHLELIDPITADTRAQYLDFLLGEMKHLGLKALLDMQSQPQDVADLVKRHRDTVAGVEVENEVLIWGIKLGRQKYWNSVYDAVKAVAPEIPVHLTAHSNSGIFNRLFALGGHSDRIGFHSYVDTPAAITSARDMALAVGNYAAKVNRPAIITEWNWRFMTRMPYEERAKLYPQIFGRALETRSITEFGQFQFTESLAMNPKLLGGIRHYDPLFLSRRPKPELFELWKLIQQYSDPDAPQNQVRVNYTTTEFLQDRNSVLNFRVWNPTKAPQEVHLSVESPADLEARLTAAKDFVIKPGTGVSVPVEVSTTSTSPGFYQCFLRVEGKSNLLTYGWGEIRRPGRPRLDLDTPTTVTYPRGIQQELSALSFDTSNGVTIVYGADAPGVEVEYALLLENTLESASGCPVNLYNSATLPSHAKANDQLILVGTNATNPLMPPTPLSAGQTTGTAAFVYSRKSETGKDWLIVTGNDTANLGEAVTDLVLRYWRNAKDSAVRKLGGKLVEKVLPKGADPTKLP